MVKDVKAVVKAPRPCSRTSTAMVKDFKAVVKRQGRGQGAKAVVKAPRPWSRLLLCQGPIPPQPRFLLPIPLPVLLPVALEAVLLAVLLGRIRRLIES